MFVAAMVLLGTGIFMHFFVLHQRKRQDQKKRAASYQAIFASIADQVKPGITRQATEEFLHAKAISYTQRSGKGTWDDFTILGRESSPVWFCNWQDTIILYTFRKSPTRPAKYVADPDDVLESVTLQPWMQQCL